MDQSQIPHFSKKVFLFSILFLLINAAWYVVTVFSQTEEFRTVSPRLIFAQTQEVEIKPPYATAFSAPAASQPLAAGTVIKTGEKSAAEIVLEDNVLRLNENTELELLENRFLEPEALAYSTESPRLVFSLSRGSVWMNAFDPIRITMKQSAALLSHSVASFTHVEPMNRIVVLTGSVDLELLDKAGKHLTGMVLPLGYQVAYSDSQLISDYALLQPSKLKKELKLAAISEAVLKDEWVRRNTAVDAGRLEKQKDLLYSDFWFAVKDRFYNLRKTLAFLPRTEQNLNLGQSRLILSYLLGAVQKGSRMAEVGPLLERLDTLAAGLQADPRLRTLYTNAFYSIGTPDHGSPAYRVKDYLRGKMIAMNGARLLRSYFADIRKALMEADYDKAGSLTENWLKKWDEKGVKAYAAEYENQARMVHGLVLSYVDSLPTDFFAVLDESIRKRLESTDHFEETLFAVTQERLELASRLVDSYRYTAAKQSLRSSYEALNIDKLDTHLSARNIFLEQANLLARRIDYAEQTLHGAARPIDEEGFREFLRREKRDALLTESLKAYLQLEEPVEVKTTPPTADEVVDAFADARIVLLKEDVLPQADFPFEFQIKNARLIDRAADGSTLTLKGDYDYSSNAIQNLEVNGKALKGSFELSDLVAVLTKDSEYVGEKRPEDVEEIVSETEKSDEALRSQVVAQDLAAQLIINELSKYGIEIYSTAQVEALDPATLSHFHVVDALIQDPFDPKNSLLIEFEYDSASKMASAVRTPELTQALPEKLPAGQLISIVFNSLYGQRERAEKLDAFKVKVRKWGADPSMLNLQLNEDGTVHFEDLRPSVLPLSISGTYDLNKDLLVKGQYGEKEAEQVSVEAFLTRLAEEWVVSYLKDRSILIGAAQIEMTFPFKTIRITGVSAGEDAFSFELDTSGNRLKNVVRESSGAKVPFMTFEEFQGLLRRLQLQQPEAEEAVSEGQTAEIEEK